MIQWKGPLGNLFLGHPNARKNYLQKSALQEQRRTVAAIWRNERYNDFGLERFIRLVLAVSQFLFPGLYVKELAGRHGLLYRKVWGDAYVVMKLLVPILVLRFHLYGHLWAALLVLYLMLETLLYLFSLVFLANETVEPVSHHRSMASLFMNFNEMVLDFSIFYLHFDSLVGPDHHFLSNRLLHPLKAVYFSYATTATVGFGEIHPVSNTAYAIVTVQIVLSLVFIGFFLNFFSSRLQTPTSYTKKREPHHRHYERLKGKNRA